MSKFLILQSRAPSHNGKLCRTNESKAYDPNQICLKSNYFMFSYCKMVFVYSKLLFFLLVFFNSIADIIEHYRKEQIVEGYYLKDPVPMQVRYCAESLFTFHCTFIYTS